MYAQKVFQYTQKYESEGLRGVDSPRPWYMRQKIQEVSGLTRSLLDVGCGTAHKIVPVAKLFGTVVALDINPQMCRKARENFAAAQLSNARVVKGSAHALPFESNSFDVATALLTRWDARELSRVLKPRGVALIEIPGTEDKLNFKLEFGEDCDGPRGLRMNHKAADLVDLCKKQLKEHFHSVQIRSGRWRTYYTSAGIDELFANTPTIRNFDPIRDKEVIDRIKEKYKTPHGIETIQQRLLITATKR